MSEPTGRAHPDNDANTFRILLATDNHVGYMEKDPIRGNDSFDSFEEILKIGQERNVDFILLGGDLFHDNKPSRKCLHTTMTLFRQYCLGDRPCSVEFLSDQSENFPNRFATVNYQDPNFNVGMPVFSIHGNHDDPSGDGSLCALDLLSVAGLVNYFGKQVEVDDIAIKPILLRKGTSRLALFGLGNVRDERLNRTFQRKKVRMFRPKDDVQGDWFNLMVLHQNRISHGPTNYIPETFLEDFLNLIVWGHEHECLVDPELNSQRGFYITQPGSSIATSLCDGEAVAKHVGILEIKGSHFQLEPVRLKTVRPFIMDEVVLKDEKTLRPTDHKRVNAFLQDRVEALIDKALTEWSELNTGVPENKWPKPLIRLKVEYSGGFTTFNPQRFGQMFVDRVANPKDILHFYRKRPNITPAGKKSGDVKINLEAFIPEKLENFRVEDLVMEILNAQNLDILPENELGDAVRQFVEKDDKDAIKEFVDSSLVKTRDYLKDRPGALMDEEFRKEVSKEKQSRAEQFEIDKTNVSVEETFNRRRRQAADNDNGDEEVIVEDDMDDVGAPTAPARGRGRGTRAGAAAATKRGRGRGRGAAASTTSRVTAKSRKNDYDEMDVDEDPVPGPSRARAPRATKAAPKVRQPVSTLFSDVELEKRQQKYAEPVEEIDDDDDVEDYEAPVQDSRKRKAPAASATTPAKRAGGSTSRGSAAASSRQTKLSFSQPSNSVHVIDDEDDDAFSNFAGGSGTGRNGGRAGGVGDKR